MLVSHPMNSRSDSTTSSRLCLQRRPLVKLLSILTKRNIDYLTLNSFELSKFEISTINTMFTNVFLQDRNLIPRIELNIIDTSHPLNCIFLLLFNYFFNCKVFNKTIYCSVIADALRAPFGDSVILLWVFPFIGF